MTTGTEPMHKYFTPTILEAILPDAKVISVVGAVITIDSQATGKQIFDAEAELRRMTGVQFELMMGRKQDENKLRIRLAKFRGVGGAT